MKINLTTTQKGILYVIPFGIMTILAIGQVFHEIYGFEIAIYFKVYMGISTIIIAIYSINLFNKGLDILGIYKDEGMKH